MRPLARLLVARARLAPPHRPVVLVSLTNDAPALVPPNPIPVREISTAPRTWNATAEIDLSTSNGFDGPGGNGSSSPKQSSGDGWAKAGRFLSLVVSAATAAGVVLWGFKLVADTALSTATTKIDKTATDFQKDLAKTAAELQKEITESAKSTRQELRTDIGNIGKGINVLATRLDTISQNSAAERAERLSVGAGVMQMSQRFADVAGHVKVLDERVYALGTKKGGPRLDKEGQACENNEEPRPEKKEEPVLEKERENHEKGS